MTAGSKEKFEVQQDDHVNIYVEIFTTKTTYSNFLLMYKVRNGLVVSF